MLINNTLISWNKTSLYINFNKNNVRMKWWCRLICFVYSMYCNVWESFMPWAGHSVDAACAQRGELTCILEAKVGICRWLVQRKGHRVSLLLVWQWHLQMQAKSFRLVPCSIDTASMTLIVVCDVTVSSHLSALNFIFTV